VVTARSKSIPEPHWQTRLATPLAGGPHAVDGGKCRMVTAAGDLYELNVADATPVLDKPLVSASRDLEGVVLTDSVGFADGTIVATGPAGSSRLLVYAAAGDTAGLTNITVPGGLACPPLGLADAVIAASRSGQIFAMDPRKRKIVAVLPLVSLSEAEDALRFARLIAQSEEQCDLVDARGKTHRIVYRAKPAPTQELSATSDAPAEVSPPALPDELSVLAVPFVGAPCLFGEHWVAAGCDGTLYLVKKP
jgi:hypothetical protein